MGAPSLRPEHVRRRVAANLEWPRPDKGAAPPRRSLLRGAWASHAGRRLKELIRRHPSLGWALLWAVRFLLLPVSAGRRLHQGVLRLEQGANKLARFLRQQGD